MLRITSGIAKGKKLILPKCQKVTAVKEVVKLAVFSIIGDRIYGSSCLDLYASSGNMGIEALSRGAAFCDFVDNSKPSIETIQKNLDGTKLSGLGNVIWDDALKFLANTQSTYDIIFADPYYTEVNNRHLVDLAVQRLNETGIFILLTSFSNNVDNIPKDLSKDYEIETRKYGRTLLTMLTRVGKTA